MTTRLWNARCWNGLAVGVFAIALMQIAGTETGRVDEPWPTLISSEPPNMVPGFAALQQRANVSLENLVQAARPAGQPL